MLLKNTITTATIVFARSKPSVLSFYTVTQTYEYGVLGKLEVITMAGHFNGICIRMRGVQCLCDEIDGPQWETYLQELLFLSLSFY